MKNFVQTGDKITVTAPYAVSSGAGVLVGALFGISGYSATIGNPVEIVTEGVFDVAALQTDTGNPGAKMYWDDANKRLTTTSAGNVLVGALTAAKTGSDTTARVYLDGVIR